MTYREPSAIVRRAAPRGKHSADLTNGRPTVEWWVWSLFGRRRLRAIRGDGRVEYFWSRPTDKWFDLDTGKLLSRRRCIRASWIEETHRALSVKP